MKRFAAVLSLIVIVMLMVAGCNHPAITSARIYLNTNQDPDKAIEQCKIAIKEVPGNPEPHFLMGKAYAMKGMYKEMNDAFNASLEIGPQFKGQIDQERNVQWGTLVNAGVALHQNSKPAEAAEKFQLATEIMPEKPLAYKYLGTALSQTDDAEHAQPAFEKSVELDPKNYETRFQLANLYYSTKQYEEAIEQYNIIVDEAGVANQFYADALARVGICYDIVGKPEEALKIYEKALAENPDNMDMRYNLGRILLNDKKHEQALEILTPVYEANPEDWENCMSYGWALVGIGEEKGKSEDEAVKAEAKEYYTKAVEAFKKATELEPEKYQSWFWLGTSYMHTGEAKKAQEAYDKSDALKEK